MVLRGFSPLKNHSEFKEIEIQVEMDIAPTDIPMLLSRRALKNMQVSVNFNNNALEMEDASFIPIRTLGNGHISFVWNPTASFSNAECSRSKVIL